jgi:hypothetical protein
LGQAAGTGRKTPLLEQSNHGGRAQSARANPEHRQKRPACRSGYTASVLAIALFRSRCNPRAIGARWFRCCPMLLIVCMCADVGIVTRPG